MPKLTLKCQGCKQEFRREEITPYRPITCKKTTYNYCKKCLEQQMAKDNYKKSIYKLFGMMPMAKANTQKKRLQEKYGYTDDVILDTIFYAFNIKGLKPMADKKYGPSIGFINPSLVDEMNRYKRAGEGRKNLIDNLSNTKYKYEYIDVKENKDNQIKLTDLNNLIY